jgi:glycosyltransferase involved in cell wall biosynthesis
MKMKISVVIAAYNRKDTLRKTISEYRKQTYENFEIVIVDNGSADGTREMMETEFPELNYLYLPDNIDIKAVNLAVERASGDILFRSDDDSYPGREDLFEKLIEKFKKYPEIDIISTANFEVRNNAFNHWFHGNTDGKTTPDSGYEAKEFQGTGAAIKREVFEKIGGFWGWGYEEREFTVRAIHAGFNARYFPELFVRHESAFNRKEKPGRWLKMAKQHIRFNAIYYPFFRAHARCASVFFGEMLLGVFKRMPLSALLEGLFALPAQVIHSRREEKNVLPRESLKKISTGKSVPRFYFELYYQYARGIFKRLKK